MLDKNHQILKGKLTFTAISENSDFQTTTKYYLFSTGAQKALDSTVKWQSTDKVNTAKQISQHLLTFN